MDVPAPLTIVQIARLLQSSTSAIEGEIGAASPEVLGWHPAPGEWCVKEVLGHLVEADRRGFAGRVQLLIEREDPELQGWDQGEVARARGDCDRDAVELLREFGVGRAAGLQLLARLTATDLRRSGRHSKVGDLSVGDIVNEWVHHDRNHLKQILANVQAYVWPQMGAAQGFSGE
ncbi:MAG: DinB family protein [Candidatus Dormibacteria bacterium]|jgi:hypothetical protein